MKYIAFFDLDHTILKINSGEALLRKAYRNGLLSTRKVLLAYGFGILYKLKLIDPTSIIKRFAKWLTDIQVNAIDTLCQEIVDADLIPAIRPEILDEIKRHKEQGANLVILSSAIDSICIRLAKHLEMHSVICSELEDVNQRYTGQPKGKFCFREEKLVRMNKYLASHQNTCEDSYYYGDSIDDLPVLEAVGHPVCINPDKNLEKIARANNWGIHMWE